MDSLGIENEGIFKRLGRLWNGRTQEQQARDDLAARELNELPLKTFYPADDNIWRYNLPMTKAQGKEMRSLKIRILFDESNNYGLLDQPDFTYAAKIGLFTPDQKEPFHYKYCGLVYGNGGDKDSLAKLAEKFPYANLIERLSPMTWESSRGSTFTILSPRPQNQ